MSEEKVMMWYEAKFSVPIEFHVEVYQNDLSLGEVNAVLEEKAKKLFFKKYQEIDGVRFLKMKMDPNSLHGAAVTYLGKEERKYHERRMKSGAI